MRSQDGERTLAPHSSILCRKQQLYQTLNTALRQNPDTVSDDLLGDIIMAAVTESRIPDMAACRVHFRGFEEAIRIRGELENSLRAASTKALQLAHLMPYIVCEPLGDEERDHEEARGGREPSIVNQTEDFQSFLVAELAFSSNPTQPTPPDPCAHTDSRNPESLPTVVSILDAELVSYLRPEGDRLVSFTDESSNFLSLYLIATTLRSGGSSPSSADRFIAHLASVFRAASALHKPTEVVSLTGQGFMWVVFNAVQGHWETHYGSSGALFMLLSHSIRALRAFRNLTSKRARKKARMLMCEALWGLPVGNQERVPVEGVESLVTNPSRR
ncbi:hypothetical protein BJX63DRAFT_417032 [Aspergillus granulosus]|uniref:Uncharacterized protein n=1 Tax=Aspergillus granulosus TaxID=176169 RepID=A0ABR4GR90_9EURO